MRTTTIEKDLFNRTLYYGMGKFQKYKYSLNYVGLIIHYFRIISEHHLSVYTGLVHKFWFITICSHLIYLSLTLKSPTQLKHVVIQVKSLYKRPTQTITY